ncbi:MAG: hypothetical protein CL846_02635 [Crocinitomicaceae bacterium]|nr:hypothetical protein [Crocinitomicaceae bacterium]
MKFISFFLSLILIISFNNILSQDFSKKSIHQEQLEYYNSIGKNYSYYENLKPAIKSKEKKRSNCQLNKVVYGWHPYWVGSTYQNYEWDLLSHFSYFSYEVNPVDGSPLTTNGWNNSSAVDAALASGNTKVTLTVSLFSDHSTFFNSSSAPQNLISSLINLVQTRGAHGVNIDFEGLPSAYKQQFATFMQNLSNQMHASIPGSEVSTVLYAVDWNNVFDFTLMEPYVDQYIIMGYAYYYQGSSSTGPCDPLYQFGSTYNYTLSRTISDYLNKGCPKNKLILGLPYYGYQWPTSGNNIPSNTIGSGTAKTYKQIKNNVSGNYSQNNHFYDQDSYTDIFKFNDNGFKQCFISLDDGFRKRLEHVNTTGIGGIGIWALGYDDGYNNLWNSINDYLTNCYSDSCVNEIHDFGGPSKNYYNNEDYIWTIAPDFTWNIDVDFTFFDLELDYDYLYIYDGPNVFSPQINGSPFTGTNSPGSFTTTSGSVTFRFYSDMATTNPGFLATYNCNLSPVSSSFNNDLNISIYPNPVTNNLKIDFNSSKKKLINSDLIILNSFGKVVKKKTIENNKSIIINVEDLDSGYYFLSFNLNSKQVLPFVKY